MKMLKQSCLFLLFFVGLSVIFHTQVAHGEVRDLGDICFELGDGTAGLPAKLSLGILSFGEGHFALHGNAGRPVSGTASINGTDIKISLFSSMSENAYAPLSGGIAMYYIVLDSNTLSGSYTTMRFYMTAASTGGLATVTPSMSTGTVRIVSFSACTNLRTSLVLKDADGIIKDEFSVGEEITLELTVTNLNVSEQTLTFTSGQLFDFIVAENSVTLWNWSHDHAFPAVLTNLKFGPLETKTFNVVWNQRDNGGVQLPAGTYHAQGFLALGQEKANLVLSPESETRSVVVHFTIR